MTATIAPTPNATASIAPAGAARTADREDLADVLASRHGFALAVIVATLLVLAGGWALGHRSSLVGTAGGAATAGGAQTATAPAAGGATSSAGASTGTPGATNATAPASTATATPAAS